jgi:hypothetical protein
MGCFLRNEAKFLEGLVGSAVMGCELLAKVLVSVRDQVGVARSGQLLPVRATELAPMTVLVLRL